MKILETNGTWKFGLKEPEEESRAYVESSFEYLTKEIFDTCPFKDKIFQGQEILFIITVGSSLNKLVDNYSDYDLVVVTKQHYETYNNYRLSYNNRNIHWYYRTIEEIYNIDKHSDDFLRLAGLFQYRFLTEDNLLYLNPDYQKEWNIFLKHTSTLSDLGFNASSKLAKQCINSFLTNKTPSKFYHKIANIYSTLTNGSVDTAYLLKVKRMKYEELSEEDLAQLEKIFDGYLKLLPTDEQVEQNIIELKQTLSIAWKHRIGAVFVHFPENGHHGCEKHCPFCLFDQLDYNIPIRPTDEELLAFINTIREDGRVQICGAGDPLYNFEKNKEYLKHIISLIHQQNRPVELVTKYLEVVDQYVETDLASIDQFIFSIEVINENIRSIIDKVTKLGKKVRIAKVANFTSDIYDIDWDFLKEYAAFYSQIDHKELLKISYRPNYNYDYRDKDVQCVQETIAQWEEEFGCHIYMHAQSLHILMPQLWNGRSIPCSETHRYIYSDLGLEMPKEN